jgi:hypothetical protein
MTTSKEKYEFRNILNGTLIITIEMADYTSIISYLEKNNLQYFTSSPNFEKPIKAVIRHLPPDTPEEDISNSLEGLGFNVTNVRQMAATRTAPNGQIHVETLSLFIVTLKSRNKISRDIQAKWP